MKNWNILWFLILLLSCSDQSPANYNKAEIRESTDDMEETFEDEISEPLAYQTPPAPPQVDKPLQKRKSKIIKTATVNLEVAKFESEDQKIRDLIKMMDGYIASENQSNEYYQKKNTLVVRLAPEKLDNFLHQLKKIGKKIHNSAVNSKDVTKEFVDMEIRIKSKTEVIKRYRELLKKARTVEEILNVENELRIVVEELEAVKGRLNYLKNQVGLSTVNIEYFEQLDRPDVEQSGFFANLGDAFTDGWDGLKRFIIGMMSIWPFLIIFGGLFIFIWKVRRK